MEQKKLPEGSFFCYSISGDQIDEALYAVLIDYSLSPARDQQSHPLNLQGLQKL